jgi:carboxypeptidase Q
MIGSRITCAKYLGYGNAPSRTSGSPQVLVATRGIAIGFSLANVERMIRTYIPLSAALVISAALASAAVAIPPPPPATPSENAAFDNKAWEIVSDLTTEIGPRLAGTEAEQRARDWAIKRLAEIGFSNVHEEPFQMPTWIRGEESAETISPFPQKLSITALGNSGSTGSKPMEGDVAYFSSYTALENAQEYQIKGKIAFVDHAMKPSQDGSSYGYYGVARFNGPNLAAKKGAKAFVVRSMGTDNHRNPHAGNTSFDAGVMPIPAGAISNPDADNLVRMIKKGRVIPLPSSVNKLGYAPTPVKMRLILTPKNVGMQKSGNVIAEVKGSRPDLPAILIACHLDSWDLATGAIDNAAGCGIITAAASYFLNGPPPKRTIRLLWAGAEEVGVWGGKAYAQMHKDEPHALAMESDFGADRVWRVDFNLPKVASDLAAQISAKLAGLSISVGSGKSRGGADVQPIIDAQNLSTIDLKQDGMRYFDIHHTPDDTLDKIDENQLQQNVIAWTMVLESVANYEGSFTQEPKP